MKQYLSSIVQGYGYKNVKGKNDRVKKVMNCIAVITISIATFFSVLFFLFPKPIFGFFTEEPEVLAIAVGYVPIAVLLFYGSALRSIMNALMNGSGNTKVNFATAILDGIVLRISLSVLFGLVLDMRHYGFWLGDAHRSGCALRHHSGLGLSGLLAGRRTGRLHSICNRSCILLFGEMEV